MKYLIAFFITLYQKLLSPDTGLPRKLGLIQHQICRFYPTCSVYTKEAILKYGVLKGGALGIKRISKCRPGLPLEIDSLD